MMKKCCNFFKNSYIYSVQTGSKRKFNLDDNIQKLRWHVEKPHSYACRTINAKLKLPHLIILKHKNNQFPT